MEGLIVHLTDAELEGLKRVFPSLSPGEAAVVALRAELRRRYHRERKAGKLINLEALERAIEQS